MFPRARRLSRASFPAALKGARRITTPHLVFAASRDVPGYAVVIPKQVARLSATRHRLKRHILALLQAHPLPPGLIVFARTGAPQLTAPDLQEEIEAGLKRLTP